MKKTIYFYLTRQILQLEYLAGELKPAPCKGFSHFLFF